MQGQTEYFLERTIELPNFKARIFRPVLTEEEKARRMTAIHKAAANILEGVIKNERISMDNHSN